MEEQTSYYYVDTQCLNCGCKFKLKAPKGIPVNKSEHYRVKGLCIGDFHTANVEKCPNCACDDLIKVLP